MLASNWTKRRNRLRSRQDRRAGLRCSMEIRPDLTFCVPCEAARGRVPKSESGALQVTKLRGILSTLIRQICNDDGFEGSTALSEAQWPGDGLRWSEPSPKAFGSWLSSPERAIPIPINDDRDEAATRRRKSQGCNLSFRPEQVVALSVAEGDAQCHAAERSGLERQTAHNRRPDSSTSLGMTDAELGFRSR